MGLVYVFFCNYNHLLCELSSSVFTTGTLVTWEVIMCKSTYSSLYFIHLEFLMRVLGYKKSGNMMVYDTRTFNWFWNINISYKNTFVLKKYVNLLPIYYQLNHALPPFISWTPNTQFLRMWPYLEIVFADVIS